MKLLKSLLRESKRQTLENKDVVQEPDHRTRKRERHAKKEKVVEYK